jgi:hypothetical protein
MNCLFRVRLVIQVFGGGCGLENRIVIYGTITSGYADFRQQQDIRAPQLQSDYRVNPTQGQPGTRKIRGDKEMEGAKPKMTRSPCQLEGSNTL